MAWGEVTTRQVARIGPTCTYITITSKFKDFGIETFSAHHMYFIRTLDVMGRAPEVSQSPVTCKACLSQAEKVTDLLAS